MSARRLLAVFLALTLVIGTAGQMVQASDMAVKMTTAAGDMPMPAGCGGCRTDDQGMPMACFAACSVVAVAILPSAPAIGVTDFALPATCAAIPIAGRHGPPDPYPPRPAILG